MDTAEIWTLEKPERMAAFIDRYLELDEMTGNRTLPEKMEMLEIATAIMPTLIKFYCSYHAIDERALIDEREG